VNKDQLIQKLQKLTNIRSELNKKREGIEQHDKRLRKEISRVRIS